MVAKARLDKLRDRVETIKKSKITVVYSNGEQKNLLLSDAINEVLYSDVIAVDLNENQSKMCELLQSICDL